MPSIRQVLRQPNAAIIGCTRSGVMPWPIAPPAVTMPIASPRPRSNHSPITAISGV